MTMIFYGSFQSAFTHSFSHILSGAVRLYLTRTLNGYVTPIFNINAIVMTVYLEVIPFPSADTIRRKLSKYRTQCNQVAH